MVRIALFISLVRILYADPAYVVLVDKKTNHIQLASYGEAGYKIVKTFHATLGQALGDKEQENDLKTPEGIYFFTTELRPPKLQPKFGSLGFAMNFPNTFDRHAGKTGSGIMLHATNEPERLKRNYDSQGCVVVKNEEIEEIKSYVRLGLTPIMIFSELQLPAIHPDESLRQFFEQWRQSWESKDMETYSAAYHDAFLSQTKDKNAWIAYKKQLTKRYSTISVQAEHVRFYVHPKYSVVSFTQNYVSYVAHGQFGRRSRGTKFLTVLKVNGKWRILDESFSERTS